MPSWHVTGLSHESAHVAGSAHRTRQWPPGQSTSHAPVQVTSQSAAASQCTRLPLPTVATQLPETCWQAIVAPSRQVASHVCAFWHAAVQPAPPRRVHAALPFAQYSAHDGPEHAWLHEAPAGHQQNGCPGWHAMTLEEGLLQLPSGTRSRAAARQRPRDGKDVPDARVICPKCWPFPSPPRALAAR
jgi:hypothetical protein